jgi:hypothetical protein
MHFARALLGPALLLAVLVSSQVLAGDERDLIYKYPFFRPAKPATSTPPRLRLKATQGMWTVFFSKDGKELFGLGGDHILRRWTLATGKEVRLLTHAVNVTLAPDGASLIGCLFEGAARRPWMFVYDLKAGKLVQRVALPETSGSPLCVTPDGKTVISASYTSTTRLLARATGKEVATLPGRRWATVMAVSPDGKR